jgi:hypothetical protein
VKKTLDDVQNEEKSLRIAATVYEINRITIQNRRKNKLIKSQLIKKRALLIENEEQFLLNFIDDYFKLEFSARL